MILFWGFLLYIFLRKCNMTKLQSLEINCYFLQVGESSSADFRCQLSSAGGLADSILLILLASLIGACYFAASCFVTHHHPILFNLFALFVGCLLCSVGNPCLPAVLTFLSLHLCTFVCFPEPWLHNCYHWFPGLCTCPIHHGANSSAYTLQIVYNIIHTL